MISLPSARSSSTSRLPQSHQSHHCADRLLSYLMAACRVDCSGYERTSFLRRLSTRMWKLKISDFDEYRQYLMIHPEEITPLLRAVLINYTVFFRDTPLWEYLAREIVPRLLQLKTGDDPIRVWCAGCSSGEEAYTIAIILAEALGRESFLRRVKVYASDIQEEALLVARRGRYNEISLRPMGDELRHTYFRKQGDLYEVDPILRRSIIFSRHDLLTAPPISRVDLVACRNTLIYFNRDTQCHLLANFHFALREYGFLFLGKAERCPGHSSKLFRSVDVRHRVFTKAPVAWSDPTHRAFLLGRTSARRVVATIAWESAVTAQLIVTRNGALAAANWAARRLFGIVPEDLGTRVMKGGGLGVLIDRFCADSEPRVVEAVECTLANGSRERFTVEFLRLQDESGLLGMRVIVRKTTDRAAVVA